MIENISELWKEVESLEWEIDNSTSLQIQLDKKKSSLKQNLEANISTIKGNLDLILVEGNDYLEKIFGNFQDNCFHKKDLLADYKPEINTWKTKADWMIGQQRSDLIDYKFLKHEQQMLGYGNYLIQFLKVLDKKSDESLASFLDKNFELQWAY